MAGRRGRRLGQTGSVDTWWVVLLLLGLMVLLNAAFSGSEIALISVRGSQLRRLERTGGPRGRAVVRLVREPNRFLATIQLGITAIGFLASATAAVTLSEPLVGVLEPLGGAAQPVAVALVTGGLTFVTLVVGELTPKRLALQAPLRWALLVAAPLDALARVSRPVVWALGAATDGLVRILLGRTPASAPDLSPEELRDLVAGHRGLTPQQRTIIVGALELDQRTLRQVLVPRREVFTVPVDWAPAPARTRLLTVLAAVWRRRLFRVRRPQGTSLIVVVPLSPLERSGGAGMVALVLLVVGLVSVLVRAGIADGPTVVALFAVFGPGIAQQAVVALGAGPQWRRTVRQVADPADPGSADPRSGPGMPSVWVAGSAASWPPRRGNLTALLDRLTPHLNDTTVLLYARTPALAALYGRWDWTPAETDPQTLIRSPRHRDTGRSSPHGTPRRLAEGLEVASNGGDEADDSL